MTLARERAETNAKNATFQAWQTARFYVQARSKKGMPKLKDAMSEIGSKANQRQSPKAMATALSILQQMYGGKIREVKPRG